MNKKIIEIGFDLLTSMSGVDFFFETLHVRNTDQSLFFIYIHPVLVVNSYNPVSKVTTQYNDQPSVQI